jgi:prolipoprotein diacylglyceryl transferase
VLIHWNVDPVILHLGPLQVRYYGLLFLCGFALAFQIVKKMAQRENKSLEKLESLLYWVAGGTVIGARLGHCLFYEPEYFLKHPLEIFAIWNGGLASHGGTIGVIVAIFLFNRKNKDFSIPWIMDHVAFGAAITAGFIRIGNLMNSEILGKPTMADWGFIFERVDQIPRHPTQIYEAGTYWLVAIFDWCIYRAYNRKPPALLLFGTSIFLIFLARIFLELFKENQEAFEAGMALNMGQILSIPFVIVGLGCAIYALRTKKASK